MADAQQEGKAVHRPGARVITPRLQAARRGVGPERDTPSAMSVEPADNRIRLAVIDAADSGRYDIRTGAYLTGSMRMTTKVMIRPRHSSMAMNSSFALAPLTGGNSSATRVELAITPRMNGVVLLFMSG